MQPEAIAGVDTAAVDLADDLRDVGEELEAEARARAAAQQMAVSSTRQFHVDIQAKLDETRKLQRGAALFGLVWLPVSLAVMAALRAAFHASDQYLVTIQMPPAYAILIWLAGRHLRGSLLQMDGPVVELTLLGLHLRTARYPKGIFVPWADVQSLRADDSALRLVRQPGCKPRNLDVARFILPMKPREMLDEIVRFAAQHGNDGAWSD